MIHESDVPPFTWKDLKFWQSGEWQVCDEELKRLTRRKELWCPGRANLFRSLDTTPYDLVRVVICGQDPYPNPDHATGLSFSVPPSCKSLPPSLVNILKELVREYPDIAPENGDLSRWAREEGVLLWNAIPSCLADKSNSHNWPEWELLTAEIFQKLSQKHVVFAFLGSKAAEYRKYVDEEKSDVIHVTHPSPRAQINTTKPFEGCRLFSTINEKLQAVGFEPVDWRLG